MDNIKKRIEYHFDKITSISATTIGCTRLSYSKEDIAVREYLIKECKKIGMSVNMDSIGNLRFIYNPNNLNSKSIMMGSHIDTVRNGGRYDGLTGVICGLETIRSIHINNIDMNHPLELVVFAEEEGSNFNVTMLGSKYISQRIDNEYLKSIYDENKRSAKEVIEAFEINGVDKKDRFITGENECAFLELHVEQGGILDDEKITLGIVNRIAGMKTLEIKIEGESNHAGSTPMRLRKDPMVAAGELIFRISKIPSELNLVDAVATVGKINALPNASNVICREVKMNIDIRDGDSDNINKMKEKIISFAQEIQNNNKVKATITELGSSEPVIMTDIIKNAINESVINQSISFKELNSGPVHDTAMLSDIVDIGMIFIPSKDGISHSPNEHTDMEDIVKGFQVLKDTIISLDKLYA